MSAKILVIGETNTKNSDRFNSVSRLWRHPFRRKKPRMQPFYSIWHFLQKESGHRILSEVALSLLDEFEMYKRIVYIYIKELEFSTGTENWIPYQT